VGSLDHQGTLRFLAAWLPDLVTWKVVSQATVFAEVNFCINESISGCILIFWLNSLSLAVQSVMSAGQSTFSFKFLPSYMWCVLCSFVVYVGVCVCVWFVFVVCLFVSV